MNEKKVFFGGGTDGLCPGYSSLNSGTRTLPSRVNVLSAIKPADCPPVDDRQHSADLRSNYRMNQEKFRGVMDAPGF